MFHWTYCTGRTHLTNCPYCTHCTVNMYMQNTCKPTCLLNIPAHTCTKWPPALSGTPRRLQIKRTPCFCDHQTCCLKCNGEGLVMPNGNLLNSTHVLHPCRSAAALKHRPISSEMHNNKKQKRNWQTRYTVKQTLIYVDIGWVGVSRVSGKTTWTIRICSVEVSPDLVLLDIRNSICNICC